MKGKTMKGTIGRSDLEGGYLTFDDGKQTYKLEGAGVAGLKAGTKVEIDGSVEKDAMGIGFGTPVLKVRSVKVL